MININQGEYRIIRVSGEEKTINKQPTLDDVYEAVDSGKDGIDSIILTRGENTLPSTVMLVDDCGMLKQKPINEKATNIVRQYYPEIRHKIFGDVVLANDNDFGARD